MRKSSMALLATLTLVWFALPAVSAEAQPADAPAAAPPDSKESEAAKPDQAPPANTAPMTGKRKRERLSVELARQGEAELRKSVRVFQQRYLLKAGRVELLLGGGTTIGDPLVNHLSADAGLLFHINEEWAVGGWGSKPFGEANETFLAIQRDFGLFPERSFIQGMGFAEVQWSPVFGKFSSFGVAVLQMDAYLLAGAGALRTTIGEDIKPAGQIGAGLRIHLLRALTLSFEIRDIVFQESFKLGDRMMQHLFGGVRIGLWIPPTVQYRYQR
ncbi:MAG: outer membrane beta-barrel domain-containing protein [Deltaproteobacteria bacterium]|nr:outer membrane beta-barrel domain-containing protein [Deltaproteobacteria bacterium]